MVTDFAGDMLCTYAEGRDAFPNFVIPKGFKKTGIPPGHHLKDLSKKLDGYRKHVSGLRIQWHVICEIFNGIPSKRIQQGSFHGCAEPIRDDVT